MLPSSTGVLLGLPPLVIQPSSVLPSKSRTQPSSFSFAVSSLSAAAPGAASSAAARRENAVFISAHHLSFVGVRHGLRRHPVHCSHHPVLGPRVASAGVELLILRL